MTLEPCPLSADNGGGKKARGGEAEGPTAGSVRRGPVPVPFPCTSNVAPPQLGLSGHFRVDSAGGRDAEGGEEGAHNIITT